MNKPKVTPYNCPMERDDLHQFCSHGTCYTCIAYRCCWQKEIMDKYKNVLEWLLLFPEIGPFEKEIVYTLYGDEIRFYHIPWKEYDPEMEHEQKLEYLRKYQALHPEQNEQ